MDCVQVLLMVGYKIASSSPLEIPKPEEIY